MGTREELEGFDNESRRANELTLPGWVSVSLLAETRAVWQPHYTKKLTDEDALEILLTVGRLLDELESEDDKQEKILGPGSGQQPRTGKGRI